MSEVKKKIFFFFPKIFSETFFFFFISHLFLDIGSKTGQNGLDNGFVGFHQYRIPRENLLNRVADVTPEGIYTAEHLSPNKRFAMILNPLSAGRVGIIGLCSMNSLLALTIAIRSEIFLFFIFIVQS